MTSRAMSDRPLLTVTTSYAGQPNGKYWKELPLRANAKNGSQLAARVGSSVTACFSEDKQPADSHRCLSMAKRLAQKLARSSKSEQPFLWPDSHEFAESHNRHTAYARPKGMTCNR